MNVNRRKVGWTLLAIIAIAAALSGLVDQTGREYADEAFKRSLVTFAAARTLNGVISVAQGTEVALEPAGVGVNFSVGQVLDPINDLVERFSAVMLVATSSLGLQNVLLRMTQWWALNLMLVASTGFLIIALWWPGLSDGKLESTAIRLLLVTLFLRFAVPTLIICTNLVFDTFLAAEQSAATQALETTRTEIEELNEQATAPAIENQSLIDRLGSMLDDSLQAMNVSERLDRLRERVSDTSEHIINLIVIFVLQTIILPVFFVWAFVELLKSLATRAAKF